MKFIPNTTIKQTMLNEIGFHTIDELFTDIPKKIRAKPLNLPKGLTQQQTEQKLRILAKKNQSYYDLPNFLGGGTKPHYVPAAVNSIISRSEFYTAYTPYQPEASQGFLQAMFEYQSIIAELTGMDIANASLYDGVTALGEAALMCTRINKRKTFLIPENISWEKKSVLKNYTLGAGLIIKEIPYDKKTGKLNIDILKKTIDEDTTGVYLENPNFFGIFEDDVQTIHALIQQKGSLFVVGIDPFSLGIIKNPGEYGADIILGEGRSLGTNLEFGGPGLGLFACKTEYLRQLPGRIIGLTKDTEGKQAFCMTLQTREQHIRRARATSNICTNEGLIALAALVHLSWLGSNGLEELSRINFQRGQSLAKEITSIKGFKTVFSGNFFNEFVIRYKGDTNTLHKKALQKGVQIGLSITKWFPALNQCLLFGVTELHTDEQIQHLLTVLREVA
ncbi:MAG: aminomethyl-transferring glycine dehydrogenase subunit GcvPA [Euryarchaeota archaeon]|nr:aminomethyl-transferring glycine dehydrogenase subunit GcvPA [Euryarchaeota archaeon]